MPPCDASTLPARAARIGRTARNCATAVEAIVALAAASLATRWLPFRWVMRGASWTGRRPAHRDRQVRARRVRWAVERCAGIVPWRALCFQRGLAAQWMLRRRGIASHLHYGIDPKALRGISAHVWITLDGVALIGGADAARHACVMVRPDPSPRAI